MTYDEYILFFQHEYEEFSDEYLNQLCNKEFGKPHIYLHNPKFNTRQWEERAEFKKKNEMKAKFYTLRHPDFISKVTVNVFSFRIANEDGEVWIDQQTGSLL